MLFRRLFLLFMLVRVRNVLSKEDSANVEVRQGRAVETRYPFNHPPSAEYYDPIPVAIVYEDQSDFSQRSEVTTETVKSSKEEEPRNVTKKDNVPTTPEQVETTTVAMKLVPKPRTLNNLQIPVAVVYESVSNSYKNSYKTKTDTTTDNAWMHRNNRRKQKAIVNVDTRNEQTTQILKPETENLQKNIETSTFGKRIGGRDKVVPILDMESYVFSHNGNFHYRYEGGDGTKAYSEGKQITIDDKTGESVVGGFSYTDKEGNDFSITYTADENGYRPVGAHLPTPPPIPPAIARALKYLATATPEPVTKSPIKPKSVR